MRFLHTADWQIGMKAAHVGAVGGRVREERLKAAERVVALGKTHDAEFLLVAGDTFEDNGVERVLVQRVADILARFPGPVFITAGNHDPLTPGSVWDHPAWSQSPKVQVLRSNEPVKLPGGGMLFPCPLREKYSSHDPTAAINARDTEGVAVGVAHGTVQGIQQETIDYPIPRDAAQRAGLDYLAIGHWHSFATFPGSDGVERLAYSGTHETTKFGERDSGNAVLVEIESRGAAPKLTPIRTGGLSWTVLEPTLRDETDAAALCEQLEVWPTPENALLEVRLRGVLTPAAQPKLERIRELAAARFFYARILADELLPSPADASWLEELPAGILRDAAEDLRRFADPSCVQRPEGVTSAVAARALLELYRHWREAQA